MASNTSFQDNLMSIQANLLNFAYMLTSNRDDAYDLLQDTTLKALDNSEKYADNTNFKAWVFTIMRNILSTITAAPRALQRLLIPPTTSITSTSARTAASNRPKNPMAQPK